MTQIKFENGQIVDFKGNPTPQDIEEVAKSIGLSAPKQPNKYFGQGIVEAVAKPFLKVGATGATLVAGAANLAGRVTGNENLVQNTQRDLDLLANEGVDTFLGKAKPIGASFGQENDMSTVNKIVRTGADIAGTALEIGSYGFAPVKVAGAGFWETVVKSPWANKKAVGAIGSALGLQAYGEGKTGKEAITEGVGGALGASAGFGLLSGGGALFGRYGGKLLQNEAVVAMGNKFKNFVGNLYEVLPEVFKGSKEEFSQNILTNAEFKNRFNAVADDYNQIFKQATDAAIDGIAPQIESGQIRDLTMNAAQQAVQKEKGKMFTYKDTLYDSIRDVTVSGFDKLQDSLAKLAQRAAQLKPMDKISGRYGEALEFAQSAIQAIKSGNGVLSMDQILGAWDRAKSAAFGAAPEDAKTILDIGQSLFESARQSLGKTNPEALKTWDLAYQNWKKAVDINDSPLMNLFKDSGDIDTFVAKSVTQGLTIPEKKVLVEAIGNDPELKQSFSAMLMKSVFDNAKNAPNPEDGAKLIDNFLSNWDDVGGVLSPAQKQTLIDTSRFMKGNLEELITSMRDSIGISENGFDVARLQGEMDFVQNVKDGNFENIYDFFFNKLGKNEFSDSIGKLKPEERQIVGLTLAKDLIDSNTPAFKMNKDGTFDFSVYSKAFEKAYNKVNSLGDDATKIYTPEQIRAWEKAHADLTDFENISKVPEGDLKNGIRIVIGLIRGFIQRNPVGGLYTGTTVSENVGMKEFTNSIQNMIKNGDIQKNSYIMIGDFLQDASKYFGIGGGKAVGELLDSNEDNE